MIVLKLICLISLVLIFVVGAGRFIAPGFYLKNKLVYDKLLLVITALAFLSCGAFLVFSI